jgi:hypothetical protein
VTSISLGAAIDRQWRSRLRSPAYLIAAVVPVLIIGFLLFQTADATKSPAMVLFLGILSALWVGGSSCVREIVDERRLVQREPHLSLLAYGLAKVAHAVILAVIQSAAISLFLRQTDAVSLPFLNLWLILFLTTVSGSLLAMLLSALCDEASTALAWFPLLLVPQVVFGGFLFPYGATKPFSLDPGTNVVTVMPKPLIRQTVESTLLRAAGLVCVSRWALEAYAAEVFEQDLRQQGHLQEAIHVSFFMPLTLVHVDVAERLVAYVSQGGGASGAAAPEFNAGTGRYRLVLTAFAVAEALLLLVLLPLRDPRRA